MAISFVEPTALTKVGRVPSAAFLAASKNRNTPAKARKAELVAALQTLTPMEGNVGPSIVLEGAQAKEVTKVAKSIGLAVKVRPHGTDGARQVWLVGNV